MPGSFAVLMLTTLYWSVLSSFIHSGNADQLANTYLFDNVGDASLPGAHTFLMKLPLFFLSSLIDSQLGFILLTSLVSLGTVAGLAFMLRRLERRPIYLGTLFLLLSSVLLMIPIESKVGALLPVNMAMLATRNLEYLLYMAALWWALSARSWWSGYFMLSVIGFGFLFASDKLFVVLAIGAVLLYATARLLAEPRKLRALHGVRFIAAAIGAGFVTAGLLLSMTWLLTGIKIVDGSTASPYMLSVDGITKGAAYSVTSVMTNFGANPVFDTGFGDGIFAVFLERMRSFSVISYAWNLLILGAVCFATWHVMRRYKRHKKLQNSRYTSLTLLVVFSLPPAIAGFALTDHFYIADARYLAISLFGGFMMLGLYSSMLRDNRKRRVCAAFASAICLVSVGIGLVHSGTATVKGMRLVDSYAVRNQEIASTLTRYPGYALVGDYWRVIATRTHMNSPHTTVPLQTCTSLRRVLASYPKDVLQTPFIYLYTTDPSQTPFPACTEQEIIAVFGVPRSAVSLSSSKDILLFYPNGIQTSKTMDAVSFQPTLVESLPVLEYRCNTAASVVNIVAHEDDDLLFLSPSLLQSIDSDSCVRTIYVTAGNSGQNNQYWLARQLGVRAAYAYMAGVPDVWVVRNVQLDTQHHITIASLRDKPSISLVFMGLPDDGAGANAANDTSLKRLLGGAGQLSTIDGSSRYSRDTVEKMLARLLTLYEPGEVRTLSPKLGHNDHTDHITTARIVDGAFDIYSVQNPTASLSNYRGYDVKDFEENVAPEWLDKKASTFYVYGQFDPAACFSRESCIGTAYATYLPRQYKIED